MILKNKVAVVTGSSDGIGKQIALKLAAQGAGLALVARNEERLNEVKNECLSIGSPKVEVYSCDISVKEQIVSTTAKIISDFQYIDILINNAGVWQKVGPLEDALLDDIEKVISTNLTGLVMLTHQLMPTLKKQPEALLLNISSHSGIEGKLGQSVYCASKWGVTGFTESLRLDLKGSNVRVAGLYQGATNTGLFEKANDTRDLSKATRPEDLATVVVFMLSQPPQIWLHDVRVEY
jgi:NADP-dependent 3-hydroxy acid dehydrogenase YdfG